MIRGRNPKVSQILSSFDEAIAFFRKIADEQSHRSLLYRGQVNSAWPIIPSLFRQVPDVSDYEDEMIREVISSFPKEFDPDRSMFDQLVRMQHFGLPTRLLDTTRNPLVALFFACEISEHNDDDGAVFAFSGDPERHKFYDSDTVSCMANLANLKSSERQSIIQSKASTIDQLRNLQAVDRLVQFIRVEKPYFAPRIKKIDLFRPISVTPKMSNPRLLAQSGSFVIFGLESSDGPEYKRSSHLTKVAIKASAKSKIRKELSALGVNGSTLFPEIDRATKRIVETYKSKVG